MSGRFPKYQRPPIIELVLGVQFDVLPGFTSGHAGWFWKEIVGSEWKSSDAMPIADLTETFGSPIPNKMTMQFQQAVAPRLMIENASGDRLIQVQSSRFHYNWRKRDGEYPHYESVFAEFAKY